ncbi:hypothetical protein NARC_70065 [Candidatus Nitrosocosmicus arcticus]|uniref:Uncharacterized protein n=1 Tax=Candidatus Nitrosocosmicus arcticus TaxID=2035267 RepID=A0A557SV53_9ARCH|nr:hypothetical protein NARC_70065 [Candidatus Nitrosocosmicus arcticus]
MKNLISIIMNKLIPSSTYTQGTLLLLIIPVFKHNDKKNSRKSPYFVNFV